MGRIALAVFGLLLIACGDHVASVPQSVDGLGALEKNPRAVLASTHPTYKATYESSMAMASLGMAPASPQNLGISTETYVARPPDFRWDMTFAGASVPGTYAVFLKGPNAYLCDDTAPAACYSLAPADTQAMLAQMNATPFQQYAEMLKDMDFVVLPRQRIVGRDAACFRWSPRSAASGPLAAAKFDGCFTAEGVMLRSIIEAGPLTVAQVATSISDTVTDADVALPFPITTAPYPGFTQPLPTPTATPTPTH